jgi:hypothetical protein
MSTFVNLYIYFTPLNIFWPTPSFFDSSMIFPSPRKGHVLTPRDYTGDPVTCHEAAVFKSSSGKLFLYRSKHGDWVIGTELEFTAVCLQILVWIYVNAIHSRVFILDLPANIDFSNLYNSILAGESVCL